MSMSCAVTALLPVGAEDQTIAIEMIKSTVGADIGMSHCANEPVRRLISAQTLWSCGLPAKYLAHPGFGPPAQVGSLRHRLQHGGTLVVLKIVVREGS